MRYEKHWIFLLLFSTWCRKTRAINLLISFCFSLGFKSSTQCVVVLDRLANFWVRARYHKPGSGSGTGNTLNLETGYPSDNKGVLEFLENVWKRPSRAFILHFCGQILRKILNLPINFIYIAGKIFPDLSYYFFSQNQHIFAQKELFFMENSSV